MPSRRPPANDWLIATAITLLALAEEIGGRTSAPPRADLGWWIAAAVAAGILVLLRRTAPFLVLTVYVFANVATFVILRDMPAAWQFYIGLLLLFTLLSEVPLTDRRSLVGIVLSVFFLGSMMLSDADSPTGPGDVAVGLTMAAISGGAGVAVRRYRALAVQAQAHSELLVKEAVSDERIRIARELHDIVAHSVSVMVMQSGALRIGLGEERHRERETLLVVEETGRAAVNELGRMLGLLRAGGDGRGETPESGITRLEDLVEQMRGTGLDLKFELRGEPVALSAGLALSAYRIVQEALTNTLKHAGPTRVSVIVGYHHRELRLEITDDGPVPGHRPAERQSLGHGLIGMRERVTLYGGSLHTGHGPTGTFTVRVSFPL